MIVDDWSRRRLLDLILPLRCIFWGGLLCLFDFAIDLGPAGILVLLVFMIPYVHFFISTSRTRRGILEVQVEVADTRR